MDSLHVYPPSKIEASTTPGPDGELTIVPEKFSNTASQVVLYLKTTTGSKSERYRVELTSQGKLKLVALDGKPNNASP